MEVSLNQIGKEKTSILTMITITMDSVMMITIMMNSMMITMVVTQDNGMITIDYIVQLHELLFCYH
jgi:hypothetical protein